MFILISAPNSLISKNLFSDLAPSFDAPIAPRADSSSVSAPLKIFLINSPLEKESPIF